MEKLMSFIHRVPGQETINVMHACGSVKSLMDSTFTITGSSDGISCVSVLSLQSPEVSVRRRENSELLQRSKRGAVR